MGTISALLAMCAGNSPVTGEFPRKSQWRGALMFSLISGWINGWVTYREAGDFRCYRTHYDVIVMYNRPMCIISYNSCLNFIVCPLIYSVVLRLCAQLHLPPRLWHVTTEAMTLHKCPAMQFRSTVLMQITAVQRIIRFRTYPIFVYK